MARTFIKDLKTGDQISQTMLVKSKRKATTRTNKPYLDLDLVDKSGQINAKVWDRADEIASYFERGDVVMIRAATEEFQGKPQLKLLDLRPLNQNEKIDWESLLRTSPYSLDQMMEELTGMIATIEDSHLKALMDSFFSDGQFVEDFRRAAAARNVHHVYQGGLLEHTLNVARLTVCSCEKLYAGRVDRDLALTGAILHDVGKVRELDSRLEIGYTTEGYLIGHLALGSQILRERASALAGFPPELLMALDHIILSHHGEKEFGSPVVPMTPEAMIVSHADNLDAKTQIAIASIEEDPNQDEEFTQYHRTLGRHFYKRPNDTPGDKS